MSYIENKKTIMYNKFKEINWNPNNQDLKSFGKLLSLGFPVVALVWFLMIRAFSGEWRPDIALIIMIVGMSIGCVSYLFPIIGIIFYRIWFLLICIIDTFIVFFLFTVIYYFIFTLYGFILRRFKYLSFQRNIPKSNSFWKDVKKPKTLNQYYRQF